MAKFVPPFCYSEKPVQKSTSAAFEQQDRAVVVADNSGQELRGYLADFEMFRRQGRIGGCSSDETEE